MKSLEAEASFSPGLVATAVLIAAVWGFNFVAIKLGVAGLPPLMLVALRFFFSVFPAIFFVRKPKLPWKTLAAYGLLLGLGQFGFLFSAIKLGAPAGLSSIIMQSQAFFTALLGALFLKERLKAHNLLGMAIGALGLAALALGKGGEGGARLDPLLSLMLLAAGLGWAAANVIARRSPGASGLGLVVWSSLFSPPPLALLSLLIEGPQASLAAFRSLDLVSLGSLAYLAYLSTLLGYGLWNRLIMRHGAARIAPFSLLVPVFALAATSLVLGERIGARELLGSALVLTGLLVHVFGGALGGRSRRPPSGS